MTTKVFAFFLVASLSFVSGMAKAQDFSEPVRALVQRVSTAEVWVDVLASGRRIQVPVRPVYAPARDHLFKLKAGDFFQGMGRIEKDQQGERSVLLLESIDFVGLRQLIGLWRSQEAAFLRFENYDQLEIKALTDHGLKRSKFTYSLAPSPRAESWMVFIQGQEGVTLGHINFSGMHRATLELFDVEQDQALTLQLMRVAP
jgi:hypothetical protein